MENSKYFAKNKLFGVTNNTMSRRTNIPNKKIFSNKTEDITKIIPNNPIESFDGIVATKISSNDKDLNIDSKNLKITGNIEVHNDILFKNGLSNVFLYNITEKPLSYEQNNHKDNMNYLIKNLENGYYFLEICFNDSDSPNNYSSYHFILDNDILKVTSKIENSFKIDQIKIKILKPKKKEPDHTTEQILLKLKINDKKVKSSHIKLFQIYNINYLYIMGLYKPRKSYLKTFFTNKKY